MKKESLKIRSIDDQDAVVSHLQQIEKSKIIQEFVILKSALSKAENEIEVYKQLLTGRCKENIPGIPSRTETQEVAYDTRWTWINKIVFVLKKIDRPLLSSEMITFLKPYEQILQYSRYPAQAFSAHLTKAVKYSRIRPYKLPGARGYYYILSNWLSEEGDLKKEYKEKIFFT